MVVVVVEVEVLQGKVARYMMRKSNFLCSDWCRSSQMAGKQRQSSLIRDPPACEGSAANGDTGDAAGVHELVPSPSSVHHPIHSYGDPAPTHSAAAPVVISAQASAFV